MKKQSKRFKALLKTSAKDKKIELKELIELVKKNSTTKFDESIDVSLRINLKQSKGGDFNLRTVVKLPDGSGKKTKIAVLCESDKLTEAKKSGADIVGSDDLLAIIFVSFVPFARPRVLKITVGPYWIPLTWHPGALGSQVPGSTIRTSCLILGPRGGRLLATKLAPRGGRTLCT